MHDGNEVDDSALPDLDEDEGEEATAGSPEEEPLALPSDFSASERRDMGLEALAVFERWIWLGHAYDLIEAVKQSINHQGAFLVDKRKHARGQKANTRVVRRRTHAPNDKFRVQQHVLGLSPTYTTTTVTASLL